MLRSRRRPPTFGVCTMRGLLLLVIASLVLGLTPAAGAATVTAAVGSAVVVDAEALRSGARNAAIIEAIPGFRPVRSRRSSSAAEAAPLAAQDFNLRDHEATTINSWVDVCRDGGPLDLRSTVAASFSIELTPVHVLDARTCAPFTPSAVGGETATFRWLLDTTFDGGIDYFVQLHHDDVEGLLVFDVVRTPSADPGTWTSTFNGEAGRAGDAPSTSAFALFPKTALGNADQWLMVMSSTDRDGFADQLPEAGEAPLDYPFSCTTVIAGRATVQADSPVAARVARSLVTGSARVAPALGDAFRVRNASAQLLADLARVPGVKVQPAGVWATMQSAPPITPDDPLYSQQWALPAVGAPAAWAVRTGSSLTLAVIDDGVDGVRKELAGRVLAGRDTFYGRALSSDADSDRGGHGTAVAGVAVAIGDDGHSLAGLDWDGYVVPVRVSDAAGCISTDAVASGIDHAVARGVDVINLSLGGAFDDPAVRSAVQRAIADGIVVVAASGNDRTQGNRVNYPAAYPGVISVGASQRDGSTSPFSNTASNVALLAPGGDGSGTPERDILALGPFEGTTPIAGTSFSAPLVAGAALLVRAQRPADTPSQIRDHLVATTTGGILDVGKAQAGSTPTPEPPPGPAPQPEPAPEPAPLPEPVPDPNLAPVRRLSGGSPSEVALTISQATFPDHAAEHAVLSRDDVFADSLAGSALVGSGPLLLTTRTATPGSVRAELDRVVRPGGTVYLLGGVNAISQSQQDELADVGYVVRRLSGASRIETAVAVADEVVRLGSSGEVLLARAFGPGSASWADSVTGGGYAASSRTPVLVTPTDSVHPAVSAALERYQPRRTVLLGGTGALSHEVELGVPRAQRVSGPTRDATGSAIANELWGGAPSGYLIVNGWQEDAWGIGLAAAAFAAATGRPLLVTLDSVAAGGVPAATRAALCARSGLRLTLAGGQRQIGDEIQGLLADHAGGTC